MPSDLFQNFPFFLFVFNESIPLLLNIGEIKYLMYGLTDGDNDDNVLATHAQSHLNIKENEVCPEISNQRIRLRRRRDFLSIVEFYCSLV